MKALFSSISLPLVALFFSSCMSSYQSTSPEARLSSIPTPLHGQEVEVFFPGEKPADTAYVKIGVLEQKAEGEVAYAKLLEQLKQKAKENGMDALLVLGKNQSTKLKSDQGLLESLVEIASGEEIRDNYYSVTTHELSAVGIKYKRNLSYLPDYVQSRRVYLVEQGKEQLVATIAVDHEGRDQNAKLENQKHTQLYQRHVQRYHLDYLLREEGPNWYYAAVAGQVKKRKLLSSDGSGTLLTVKITYNAAQLPQKLELHSLGSPQQEIIILAYNDRKQVTEKLIYSGKELVQKETNQFDVTGKLVSTVHEKVQGQEATPFLKTVYDYYPMLSRN